MTSSRKDLEHRLDVLEQHVSRPHSEVNAVHIDACTAIVRTDHIDHDTGDGLRNAVRTNCDLRRLVLDRQRNHGRLIRTLTSEMRGGFASARADSAEILAALGRAS